MPNFVTIARRQKHNDITKSTGTLQTSSRDERTVIFFDPDPVFFT